MNRLPQTNARKPDATAADKRARASMRLLQAVMAEDLREARQTLEAGADVNVQDKQGMTALMYAIGGGNEDSAGHGDGGRAMEKALRRESKRMGDAMEERVPEMVQVLLQAGAQVNLADIQGRTAIHLAILSGNAGICKELLRRKANVNAASHDGTTPAALAAMVHSPEIVELLLKSGADPSRRNSSKQLPILILAIMRIDSDEETSTEKPNARVLLQALSSMMQGRKEEGAERDKVVDILLRSGVDPNDAIDGATPLLLVAEQGTPQLARRLIAHGAKVNTAFSEGTTPLAMASAKGRADIGRVLLEAGANPNTADKDGDTPLIMATEQASYVLVELLLKAGAKTDAQNKNGQSARERAVALHLTAIVRLLDSYAKG